MKSVFYVKTRVMWFYLCCQYSYAHPSWLLLALPEISFTGDSYLWADSVAAQSCLSEVEPNEQQHTHTRTRENIICTDNEVISHRLSKWYSSKYRNYYFTLDWDQSFKRQAKKIFFELLNYKFLKVHIWYSDFASPERLSEEFSVFLWCTEDQLS